MFAVAIPGLVVRVRRDLPERLFPVPNNHKMFPSASLERSGAAGGMQGTAQLAGQTAASVITSLLFSAASANAAPRRGLGIGALLALAAGMVSLMRASPAAGRSMQNPA